MLLSGLSTYVLANPTAKQQPWHQPANEVCSALHRAQSLYQQQQIDKAKQIVSATYFQLYDVVLEPAVRTHIGGKRVFLIERQFRQLSNDMVVHPSLLEMYQVQQTIKNLCQQIYQDAQILNQKNVKLDALQSLQNHLSFGSSHANTHKSFLTTTLEAFFILLREGFEAMLIITALLAYLRKANALQHAKTVYSGITIALGASVLTAYLFNTLFQNAGTNREAMEGITMLIAAGVLLYVSYWLFANGRKRQVALQARVTTALSQGNAFALGLAAFLAVYREGAETILFYQALSLNQANQTLAIVSGIGVALIALAALYWLMQTASIKIPFKLFFSVTAIFLYYMAFTFIGNGIIELQEAQWLPLTALTWIPDISLLGIHPNLQSITAQLLFLIPTLLGLMWWYRKQIVAQRYGH
ncbi:MAG: hypothetical protein Tsb005_10960 [Gammaproteobacteria bacterium]